MKKIAITPIIILAILSGWIDPQAAYAALSGSYTINAKADASPTNYQNFQSLASDLGSGSRTDGGTTNGPGISGPVTVVVVPGSGPYTEQIRFGVISGASSSKRITIKGNYEVLQFTATSSSSTHTLQLDGSDYFTIDSLVVKALATDLGRCIHLMNSADYNEILNCNLEMPNLVTPGINSCYFGITNGLSRIQESGHAGQENVLSGCFMSGYKGKGPYAGVAFMDHRTSSIKYKNYFTDNIISDWSDFGIFTTYGYQQTISRNEIYNRDYSVSQRSGIYNYCYNRGGDYIIEDNYIHDLKAGVTAYGIYHYIPSGKGSTDLQINRNKIVLTDANCRGIYITGFYSAIQGKLSCSENNIDIQTSTLNTQFNYGIDLRDVDNTSFTQINVNKNRIKMISGPGVCIHFDATRNNKLVNQNTISNNIIDFKFIDNVLLAPTAIFADNRSSNKNVDILYNTVVCLAHSTTLDSMERIWMMRLFNFSGRVANNNFVNQRNYGRVYGIENGAPVSSQFSHNNLYHAWNGSSFFYYDTSTMLAGYQSLTGDSYGVSIDPQFADQAGGNFKPTNASFNNLGTPFSHITVDYNDINRSTTTPDIGALEFGESAVSVTCKSAVIYLNSSGTATLATSDVFDGTSSDFKSLSLDKTSFTCADAGTTSVILTGTDNSDNQTSCTATVTITDTVKPLALCANATLYLNENGTASLAAADVDGGSTDACGPLSLNLDQTAFNCDHTGMNEVVLTVVDANFNSSTCKAKVEVRDDIAPVVLCKNITKTLATGNVGIDVSEVTSELSDACGILSVQLSQSSFDCSDLGLNMVTVSVSDHHQNTSVCTAEVTVLGETVTCNLKATPGNDTYTGGVATNLYLGYGPQNLSIEALATGGSSFSYSWSGSYLSGSGRSVTFTPVSAGNYVITCTVTNEFGCSSECEISACVQDIKAGGSGSNSKVKLCHVPPGNPNNPQTLSISISAVPAHLEEHEGDALGTCNESCGLNKAEDESYGEIVGNNGLSVAVYPNPFRSEFQLEVESALEDAILLELFDLSGKVIRRYQDVHTHETLHFGSELSHGMYFLKLTQGGTSQTIKLMKTN